jgi:hypothetical protein
MTTLKTLTLAATLIAGATSLAIAQNGPATGANGNNGMPPESYKGPGAMQNYSSSDFRIDPGLNNRATGGAAGSNGMPPTSYQGPGSMPAYPSSGSQ